MSNSMDETLALIEDGLRLGKAIRVMSDLEVKYEDPENPDIKAEDLPFVSDERTIPSSTPGGKPLGTIIAHASTAEKLTASVRELDKILNPMHIETALSGATITAQVKGNGYNIQIPRLSNNESLREWKNRTSDLAETLRTASEGAITPTAVGKSGRIVANVKPSEITDGLFSNVA